MKKQKMWWYAFTPAGSLLMETGNDTKEGAIAKLLIVGAHMPYGTWDKFKKRGYTVEQMGIKP